MKQLFLASILCMAIPSLSQVNRDSLKYAWNDSSLPDTARLNALNNLAWDGYIYSYPDSSFHYAQLQYELAKSLGIKKHMGIALNTQGISFYMRGDNIKAIDYLYKSLKIKEEINDSTGISMTLNNIGMTYDDMQDYTSAIKFYTQSIALLDDKDERAKKGRLSTLHNLGVAYLNQGDLESALEYTNNSLNLSNKLNLKSESVSAHIGLGDIYVESNNLTTALDHYEKASGFLNEIEIWDTRSTHILNGFGLVYERQGDYKTAINYSTKALQQAQKEGLILEARDAAHTLYRSFKALRNIRKALEMHELFAQMQDSTLAKETQNEIIRQEYKYLYEKQAATDSVAFSKQQEIKNLKIAEQSILLKSDRIEKFTLYSILILILLLVGVSYLSYRRKITSSRIIALQKKELEIQNEKILLQHKHLEEQNLEIKAYNNNLESLVEKRTLELKESLKQLSRYQYDLVHNIRGPLTSCMGLLDLIEENQFDSKENQMVFNMLRNNSLKMDDLIRLTADKIDPLLIR